MDQGEARGFHDMEQEDKLAVFTEPIKLFFLIKSSHGRLLFDLERFRHLFIQPHDIHM